MSNSNSKNNGSNQDRKIVRLRFNLSWFYLLLILGIGWLLMNNSGGNPQKVEWAEVQTMFREGDIKEITYIRNDFRGDITIRPDRLAKFSDQEGHRQGHRGRAHRRCGQVRRQGAFELSSFHFPRFGQV